MEKKKNDNYLILLIFYTIFTISFVSTKKFDPGLYNLLSPKQIGNIFGSSGSLLVSFFSVPFGFMGVFIPVLLFIPLKQKKEKNWFFRLLFSLFLVTLICIVGGIITFNIEEKVTILLFGALGFITSKIFHGIAGILFSIILSYQIYNLLKKIDWKVFYITIPTESFQKILNIKQRKKISQEKNLYTSKIQPIETEIPENFYIERLQEVFSIDNK